MTMADQEEIRRLYEENGRSLSEIARMTGRNYRTVRKYAYRNDWNPAEKLRAENSPVPGEHMAVIDQWLEEDRKVPRKQRHTARRVYDRLVEERGYRGSYSSVRRYVHRKKELLGRAAEGFVPLESPEGHAQTDFGEFVYRDGAEKEKKGYALTVTFPYSNHGYTQVFPSQNQECLLEGLKRVFEHIGGVPPRLRFDNLSAAVAQVLQGHERVLTEGFTRFKLHCRFQADFCNPAKGNEKGNVENKVGYTRRNLFVPVPDIPDFAAFNAALWDRCEKDAERTHYRRGVSIRELWEQERDKLLALPDTPYEVFRYTSLAVSNCGFVTVDTNRYGLSPLLAGQTVQAKVWFDRVEFFREGQKVGTYARCYGHNAENPDWTQYVSVLARKPGATEHSRFFGQMPEGWRQLLSRSRGKERKSAPDLLSEMVRDGNAELCADALELAAENGRTDAESIRQCYYMIARKEFRPDPLRLDNSAPALHYRPDLSAYDGLMGGDIHD